MKKVAIVGAMGFGGAGLIDLLYSHPEFKINSLIDRRDIGLPINKVFPHLTNYCNMPIQSIEEFDFDCDLAFFSTPDQAGMTMIDEFVKRKVRVIDFSGDFRFNNINDYAIYAANKGMDTVHHAADKLTSSVYGLPEKYANEIKNAGIVGNPGCFAICMILGLLPAIEAKIIDSDTIVCDGKSGVSGAGKNSGEANLYPQRHENINTYREGKHQHLVEVENIARLCGAENKKIFFIPQVIPMSRGILNNMYFSVREGYTTKKVHELYTEYYKNKPFVRITESSPNTSNVVGSNFCEIRVLVDERTGKMLITSVIDNLLKGQSGNAVQNANIMMGYDETLGLQRIPFFP